MEDQVTTTSDAPVEDAASEELETTTPEEVLSILGKQAPAPVEDETEEEVSEEESESVEDEAEAESEEEAPVEEEEVKADPVVEDATVEDVPSFALEVEDAEGNKLSINPGDNLEEVLKDFEPKSNGQIFQIIKDVMRLEGEKSSWDADQATATADAERQQTIDSIQAGWDSEIKALQGEKRLAVDAKGNSSERVDEVFKFLAEENAKRTVAGQPLLQSFEDALDKLELGEKRTAEVTKAKEEKELAKKRGGLVGGSSAPATSGVPVYKGGARNSNEALRQMGLIK